MIRYEKFYTQYCITVGLLSLLLFVYGFFPIKKPTEIFSSEYDFPHSLQDIKFDRGRLYHNSTSKTILMVIDALRVDFITSDNMPYTVQVMQAGGGCQVTARVAAPTVTMPRLKAIVTGGVSGFIDVVLNLGTAELTADNIIGQFTRTRRAVFYGDDTWLKLFPKQFIRSEGTSSFFVNDYTEVDNNVTRHLDHELQMSDWDLMVLHYLGVDHIGHIEGPKSPLIQPKMLEMDTIVRQLHTYLMNQEGGGVLVMCGDHGMKDTGSHGGTSLPEVLVPVVVLGLPCVVQPEEEIFQVDLAATLSVLWGSPIPADNIGVVRPQLLAHLSPARRLYAQLYNAQQLSTTFLRHGGTTDHEGYQLFEEAVVKHYDWVTNSTSVTQQEVQWLYEEGSTEMSRYLSELMGNYHLPAMCAAILVLGQVVVIMGLRLLGDSSSLSAQDLSLMISAALLVGIFLAMVVPALSQLALVASGLFFTFNGMILFRQIQQAPSLLERLKEYLASLTWDEAIIPVGSAMFYVSLFSSSMVEEEHQLWYFLWATVAALRLLESPAQWLAVLATHRFLRRLNSTGDKWAHLADISDWLIRAEQRTLLSVLCGASLVCVVLCCARVDGSRSSVFLSFCAAFFMYQHKAATQHVYSLLPSLDSDGVTEARACWWLLLALLLLGRSYRSLLVCSLLVACLLLRPYNTLLVPALFVTSHIVSSATTSTVLHLWIGYVFFFYQGNSNGLASVDLAAGFVGMDGYCLLPAAAMLLFHTYAMPILAYLLHVHAILDTNRKWMVRLSTCSELLAFMQLLQLFIFLIVVTIQRYHLFVWTVFSPKLLYLLLQTVLYFFLVTFTNLCIFYAESRKRPFDV